jgi:translocation and assembly module TamB
MRRLLRWLAVPVLLAVIGAGVGVLVLRSQWLRGRILTRIVEEVERATGGKASLEAFDFHWSAMEVSTGAFVLRGKEEASRAPLFRAKSIRLGLTVHSWLNRDVELRAVTVDSPEVHIYVAADGTTNLPEPKVATAGGNPVEDLIRLKIGVLDVKQGVFDFDSRQVPFATRAEGLDLLLKYDRAGPRYRVEMSAKKVDLPGNFHPRLEAKARLEANEVWIESSKVQWGESHVEVEGPVRNFHHPDVDLSVQGAVLMRDIPDNPVAEGFGTFSGRASYHVQHGIRMEGHAEGNQLAFFSRQFSVRGVRAAGEVVLTPKTVAVKQLRVSSPYGDWSGSGELTDWRKFELKGTADRIALDRLQATYLSKQYPWNASLTGPVAFGGELSAAGLSNGHGEAVLDITPREGELPVEGQLDVNWNQSTGRVGLNSSYLATAGARLNLQGTLGEKLEVGLFATRLRDLNPIIAMLSGEPDFELPVTLRDGEARVDATLDGPLNAVQIRGKAALTNVVFQDILFARAESRFQLGRDELRLQGLSLAMQKARGTGDLRLGLREYAVHDNSPLSLNAVVTKGELEEIARLAHLDRAVSGALEGNVVAGGTLGMPTGQITFTLDNAAWGTEKFSRMAGQVSLDALGELRGGLAIEQTRIELAGSYRHPPANFRSGDFTVSLKETGFMLKDSEALIELRPGLDGAVASAVRARVVLENGKPQLRFVEGSVKASGLHVGGRRLGDLTINGETSGDLLNVQMALAMPSGRAEGDARVRLAGDYPSEGKVNFPRIGFGLIHDLTGTTADPDKEPEWPMRGFLRSSVTWKAPLGDPRQGSAEVTIQELQMRPRDNAQLGETQVDTSEMTLRNSGPLVLRVDNTAARVVQAKVTALNTDLTASGSYTFHSKSPWNAALKGAVNMAVLSTFRPDLVASGSASIDASLRGAAADPQLSGKMSITGASFYLKDLPNGIENASGTVYFEKQRANIEKLTGQTGGGTFDISGFVGYSRDEVSYRLQATASNIRVRYPEGVSTTLDASMSLTGSSARSLLAGNITVQRAGIVAGGDVASMVGGSGNPIPAAASQHEFLRNLQFDIRVRTSPNATFQSSYTQDLQTEADLRLRGSPAKPILLGSIKSNQGGVQFFGNRYTISRGEVLFYNTAIVQPQIDLDLETKIRGVTVYINVSGPLSRLNINYRSEPPLQSSEILALLTVGRSPTATSTSVTASQSIRSQSVMENSPNSLLGGALSAGVSSRVERFFGSSRIKIDPNFTGVENLPQARLSVEQSISRDITVTFITNLSRSQQQVVRVEWDVNRQWSVIAVKDENGTFAVDFLFRRRFK